MTSPNQNSNTFTVKYTPTRKSGKGSCAMPDECPHLLCYTTHSWFKGECERSTRVCMMCDVILDDVEGWYQWSADEEAWSE